MTEDDVLDKLGEPDAILTKDSPQRMMSNAWLCTTCQMLHEFDAPVRVPAPCLCGGISFVKRARREQ